MKTLSLDRNILVCIVVFALCHLSTPLFAQQNFDGGKQQIIGRLIDNSQQPIPFATISLLSQDSTIITGVLSDAAGIYNLKDINPGAYFLRVRHLEYQLYLSSPIDLKTNELKTLPDIELKAGTVDLKEVVVVAKKPLFEIQADKIVFNVEASPSASGSNGLDLLKESPGVTLDMDNNISLLGKGGVQIYINGRPSRLSGNDLAMMLQSLSSDNVATIEIISNPSSKYEAEGGAGIINIKIKKNLSFGFNGTANANSSKGNYYRNSVGIAVNYGGSKLKAAARLTNSKNTTQFDFLDTKDQNGFFIDSKSYEVRGQNSYNLDLSLDYQLNEKHSLYLSGTGILNDNDGQVLNNTQIFTDQKELQQILDAKTLMLQNTNNYNFSLQHRWDINSSENFSAEASYGVFKSDKKTDQPNTFFGPDGENVLSVRNTNFDAMTAINLFSIMADYEKSFEKIKFSGGSKYGVIGTDNNFNFYNIPNGTSVRDETRSNQFTYLEKVFALYGIADIKLNKLYKLNLGLRMESTNSRGQLFSSIEIDNNDVLRRYTNIFPNMALSYNDQKIHAWNLSVGRRITRPSYTDLNPFITPQSQLLFWQGNPFLRPNFIMNYQFMYTLKQSLTITNSYSVTKDFFASIFETVGDNGNRIVPQNMQKATNYGISVSYPLKVTKFWNITSFLNGSLITYNGDLNGTLIDISLKNYSLRIQNNFKLVSGLNMDISYSRNSDWIWRGSIQVRGTQSLNLGLRKEFFKKNLQINLTGSDIFRTNSDFYYFGEYGGIISDGYVTFDNRRVGISLVYKFGNQKIKTSKKSSSLNEELRRLEGSN